MGFGLVWVWGYFSSACDSNEFVDVVGLVWIVLWVLYCLLLV